MPLQLKKNSGKICEDNMTCGTSHLIFTYDFEFFYKEIPQQLQTMYHIDYISYSIFLVYSKLNDVLNIIN